MTCASSSNLNALDLNPRRQNHLGLSEIEWNDGGVDVSEQGKVSGNGTRRRYESGNESGIDRKQRREREKEHVEELSRITKKPDQQSSELYDQQQSFRLTRFGFALKFTTMRDRDELERSIFRIDGKFAHCLNHFEA